MTDPENIELMREDESTAETFHAPVVPHIGHKHFSLDNSTLLIIAVVIVVVGFGIWVMLDYSKSKAAATSANTGASNEQQAV